MLPFPSFLLFLPVCVFAMLFVAAMVLHLTIAARTRKKLPVRTLPSELQRPSAQIIYFRPRKTFVRSGLSLGAR